MAVSWAARQVTPPPRPRHRGGGGGASHGPISLLAPVLFSLSLERKASSPPSARRESGIREAVAAGQEGWCPCLAWEGKAGLMFHPCVSRGWALLPTVHCFPINTTVTPRACPEDPQLASRRGRRGAVSQGWQMCEGNQEVLGTVPGTPGPSTGHDRQ